MSGEKHYIQQSDLTFDVLKRKPDAHKGNHGCIAIVGGDDGMLGALLLASRTALFCGAGRVYAFALSKDKLSVDCNHPEVMFKSIDDFHVMIESMDSIVIGPGLGQSLLAEKQLHECLSSDKPLVIDADALNLIAKHQHLAQMLRERKFESVITPHLGEASRLLKQSITNIQQHREDTALLLANTFQCICVLKGANSICANNQGDYSVNPTGNAGLASAGTGDVLSGLIGGLIAQGMACFDALKLAVYVHGQAADNLVESGIGPIGLTASEVTIEIRNMLNKQLG
ncbi:MAG: NAD(P)H-hydrate dehydratase [Methylophilales bacterium 28-44-11]|nr:MAG: NAD(P)H-hydrate dehydratase [Methylophilales bacterium 28-44-11]OYZ03171.1 MAG: NAD(P)H-hydrate dehydratase [Methylophilales bacterium 16-45-7]